MAIRIVLLLVVLTIGAALGFRYFALPSGHYRPSEYPRLRGMMRAELVAPLPGAIPPGAKGVRLRADGPDERFPAPDWNMELRYMTTPAAAAQVEGGAIVADGLLKKSVTFTWNGVPDRLETADDQDPTTPLPGAFRSYLLANPDGINITGVSVNAASGEVIYWIFEG